MSVVNNYQVQTGVWNQPQIISFDSLFTTYSIENVFNNEEMQRMTPILSKWRNLVAGHFEHSGRRPRPSIASYITNNANVNGTTAHVQLPESPMVIYKTYYHLNSSLMHPMANTLRAPMSSVIQKIIDEDNLDKLGVPRKGLYALFSKEKISQLNEQSINEAFIVCAEKEDVFTTQETKKIVRESPAEFQHVLANQCCSMIVKSGITDNTWGNMRMHRYNQKLYSLDTEAIEYELFIDKFGKGFESCAKAVNSSSLASMAKKGLTWLYKSCINNDMTIFEETATTYLERMD